LWTGRSLGAGCASSTLWSCGTRCTLGTLRSCGACFTRITFRALHALRTLRSCSTCWPRWAGGAWSTGFTLLTLDSLLAFRTRRTLRTLYSLGTFRTGRTLRREHVDLELIVADDISDKIRNSKRRKEEIAQTLTSVAR
jgi:hypothetical protein